MEPHQRAIRAAREVAYAASQLAAEAASLARVHEEHPDAGAASIAASEAAVRAAKIAFDLDRAQPDGGGPEAAVRSALQASFASLEAAAASVQSTRAALDAALAISARGGSRQPADG